MCCLPLFNLWQIPCFDCDYLSGSQLVIVFTILTYGEKSKDTVPFMGVNHNRLPVENEEKSNMSFVCNAELSTDCGNPCG